MHLGHAYEALLPKIEMECLRWPEKLLKLGGLEFSGLMVSALDSGVSSPGSSPGQGHRVLFLGKALYSHGASLHLGV